MSNFGTTDIAAEVSRGNINGQEAVLIGGINFDIDSGTEEDLWVPGGSLVYLSSAETMNIVSTSTSDDVGGTGATSLFISGMLGGVVVTDIVTMDGTSNVLTTQTFDFVQFMFLLGAGSGRTNAGIITATASSAGTVQCGMAIGYGISSHGFRRTITGKSAIIRSIEINGTKLTGGALPVITFRIYARFTQSSPWVVILNRSLDTAVQNQLIIEFPYSGILGPGSDLRMAASTDQNNTIAEMRVTLLEYDV